MRATMSDTSACPSGVQYDRLLDAVGDKLPAVAIGLFDDLRALDPATYAASTMILVAVQMTLGYVSLALIAWRPGVASALMPVPLVLALFTHNYASTLICAVIVTVATVSMLPRMLTMVYSLALAAWIITAVVVESTTDALWIMGTPLVIGVMIGGH